MRDKRDHYVSYERRAYKERSIRVVWKVIEHDSEHQRLYGCADDGRSWTFHHNPLWGCWGLNSVGFAPITGIVLATEPLFITVGEFEASHYEWRVANGYCRVFDPVHGHDVSTIERALSGYVANGNGIGKGSIVGAAMTALADTSFFDRYYGGSEFLRAFWMNESDEEIERTLLAERHWHWSAFVADGYLPRENGWERLSGLAATEKAE